MSIVETRQVFHPVKLWRQLFDLRQMLLHKNRINLHWRNCSERYNYAPFWESSLVSNGAEFQQQLRRKKTAIFRKFSKNSIVCMS